MNNMPILSDLRVFVLVARRAGFAAAAEELGVSPAFISKRIALLEKALDVSLLHRTTRRVAITEDGERIYEWAQRILNDVDQMMDELSEVRRAPQGMLRVVSSFGFGRRFVAPALSALAREYPQLELRLDVSDRLVDLVSEGFDLDIRIGDDIAPNLIARKLADNQRILCASPAYLQRHGVPKSVAELAGRACPGDQGARSPVRAVAAAGAGRRRDGESDGGAGVEPRRNRAPVVPGRAGRCAAFRTGREREHRQRQIGAHSAGVFSAGQHLGGVRFPAGNVGESAGDGRILRDYFREHYGETGAASENPPRP